MADKKITALTDLGDSLADADLFHVVDDPTGSPINKKITATDVFNNIPHYIGLAQTADTLTGDGSSSLAASVTTATTFLSMAAGTGTVTLADGTDGQIKIFLYTSASSIAADVTPTTPAGFSKATLNSLGHSLVLMFKSSKWFVLSRHPEVVVYS
jgi:hypothetical protein